LAEVVVLTGEGAGFESWPQHQLLNFHDSFQSLQENTGTEHQVTTQPILSTSFSLMILKYVAI